MDETKNLATTFLILIILLLVLWMMYSGAMP